MPMAIEPKLDCYAILEVSSDAEDAVIRTAFAAQVQKFGSEQFSGAPAEGQQRLSDLNAAYQVLIDPVRRRRYDLHRRISAISAACSQTNSSEAYDAQLGASPAPGKNPVPTAGHGRSRVPLYVLIAAVIALTAFSTFRYSNLLPERAAASPSAPPIAVAEQPAVKTQIAPVVEEMPPPAPAVQAYVPPPQEVQAADAKPVDTKVAGTKVASSRRRGNADPAVAPSETCSDVVAVLGLCKPKSTVENR